MFKTDFFVCGIAPMGENLVILSYDLDGMQQEVCIKVGATDNAAMVVQLQCTAGNLFFFFFCAQACFCLKGPVRWLGRRLWPSEGPPCRPTAVLGALLHGATSGFSEEGAEL